MPPLTSSPPLLSRLYLSVLCNKIIKEDSALHCGRQRSPQTLETRISSARLVDPLTFGDCGQDFGYRVLQPDNMVKTTREGENRRSPRISSSAGTRLREEQTASQIRSPGSMKGDTPVDPTEPPDSKFMTASKQPALTLVALAAAEDHGRQLPDSAFASENQAACMNPTCAYTAPARDSPLFPNEPSITHSATSECFAPARDSPLFSMNLHSLQLTEKTFLLLPSGAPIFRRRMLHHLQLRARQGILAKATVRRGTPARAQAGQKASGRPLCTKRVD